MCSVRGIYSALIRLRPFFLYRVGDVVFSGRGQRFRQQTWKTNHSFLLRIRRWRPKLHPFGPDGEIRIATRPHRSRLSMSAPYGFRSNGAFPSTNDDASLIRHYPCGLARRGRGPRGAALYIFFFCIDLGHENYHSLLPLEFPAR